MDAHGQHTERDAFMREWMRKKYATKAEWNERAALLALGSLVVQQVVEGVSLASPSVMLGVAGAILAYVNANRLLNKVT
jgi:hypothetical protein